MRYLLLFLASATLLSITGCEPRHIKPYTPRERNYTPDKYAADENPNAVKTGALWNASNPSLFEDLRASRLGDILTVVIDEESDGQGNASTSLGSSSEMESGVSNVLGLMASISAKYPKMDPTKLISLMGKSDFQGDGKTSRSNELSGKIAVRVKQVLPNGDLYIEGNKVILINAEELHFYISGVVRQTDVQPDNSVRSSLIADAQVEFSGRGVVTDKQAPGWLHRLVDKFKPV